MQEMTHGMVAYDAPVDFVICPECGETVDEGRFFEAEEGRAPPRREQRRLPRSIPGRPARTAFGLQAKG
ncbi:MAG: hypothetical protein ACOY93_15885 [Bacillota bacterium]